MVIWRYKADGTLDTAFNMNGIVVNNGAAGSNGDDTGRGVAVDSNGRIVVTGSSTNISGNTDMVVWRFNDDGAIDVTFDSDGIAAHNGAAGGNDGDSGSAVAIDFRDRMIVAGSSSNSAGNSDMVIWRMYP